MTKPDRVRAIVSAGCEQCGFHYSTFAPESLTALRPLGDLALDECAELVGGHRHRLDALRDELFAHLLAVASALLISALSFATIGAGVFAGAMIATQGTPLKPG